MRSFCDENVGKLFSVSNIFDDSIGFYFAWKVSENVITEVFEGKSND